MATSVLNILYSVCCCLYFWQPQMIFISQTVLHISLCKNVFHKCFSLYVCMYVCMRTCMYVCVYACVNFTLSIE